MFRTSGLLRGTLGLSLRCCCMWCRLFLAVAGGVREHGSRGRIKASRSAGPGALTFPGTVCTRSDSVCGGVQQGLFGARLLSIQHTSKCQSALTAETSAIVLSSWANALGCRAAELPLVPGARGLCGFGV